MTTCSDTNPDKGVPQNLVTFNGDGANPNECIAKCIFWYNYSGSSSCNITNNVTQLSILYDGGGDIMYNSDTYTPINVRIFSPSLHTYDGVQAEAELVLEHTSKSASMAGLLVCVPISTTAPRSNASVILESIIDNAPKDQNDPVSLSLANFNMNGIIPSAPYYTYSGPLPYDACVPDTIYQYIVFHPTNNGALGIDKPRLEKLGNLILYSNIAAVPASESTPVFFNPKGTSQNGFNGEDQIYIQCQPAGESEETKVYKEPKSPFKKSGNNDELIKTIVFSIFGALFIVGCFFMMNFITKKFKYTPPELKLKPGAVTKLTTSK
jgi:hypothetical protein